MTPKFLYHYSGNVKCFSILSNKSIRLSDIRKSNDSAEMQIFYPAIIDAIKDEYEKNPFDFAYENYENKEAITAILNSVKKVIDDSFSKGKLTSYVLCLSEDGDLLSQWRGYADNGKGCSLGFDIDALRDFCNRSNGVFALEKIRYLTQEEIENLIVEKATSLKKRLHDYVSCNEYSSQQPLKEVSKFLFDIIDEIGKTIIYKSAGFAEEKEWRLYINDWVSKTFVGYNPGGSHSVVAHYLEGKISYHVTENDIIPFILLQFGENPSDYIKRIILGPSNKISNKDIALFLQQNQYTSTEVSTSKITYR